MRIPSDLAGVPAGAEVPPIVAALPGGDRAEAAWENALGGLTFRLPAADGLPTRHVKWQRGDAVELAAEAERLRWAARFVTVPPVASLTRDGEEQLLVTETIPGVCAVLDPWNRRPREAARALGAGLRAFHDALPVEACPWEWQTRDRLARLRDVDDRGWLTATHPDVDRLVVCHGDACAPNTLLGSAGTAIGHVDLGALGVADFWADLAVLAMSTVWNYGAGYEDEVYRAYGVAPDPERITFYRDLWNAE